jgi:SAM-dependent methyltransferase
MRQLRTIANWAIKPFGLKVVGAKDDLLFYQHDYADGGYDAYRETQIRWNKAKLGKVWADERTLEAVAADIERRGLQDGICQGARNGFEVQWFRKRLGTNVIGTDISDTAIQFPNMVVHDFHETRAEWRNKWDFIYTNSLDQAHSPDRAIATWVDQLTPEGRIYIEHTMAHSPKGAGEMDPFGAQPIAMPYLLLQWGTPATSMLMLDDVPGKGRVWVFIVGKPQRYSAGG